jgi:hypothetical protein
MSVFAVPRSMAISLVTKPEKYELKKPKAMIPPRLATQYKTDRCGVKHRRHEVDQTDERPQQRDAAGHPGTETETAPFAIPLLSQKLLERRVR